MKREISQDKLDEHLEKIAKEYVHEKFGYYVMFATCEPIKMAIKKLDAFTDELNKYIDNHEDAYYEALVIYQANLFKNVLREKLRGIYETTKKINKVSERDIAQTSYSIEGLYADRRLRKCIKGY